MRSLALVLSVLLLGGCPKKDEKSGDVFDRYRPKFEAIQTRLLPIAAHLPPPGSAEQTGPALSPPAVLSTDDRNNTSLLRGEAVFSDLRSCVQADRSSELAFWLDVAAYKFPNGMESLPVDPRMLVSADASLKLRYVALLRTSNCSDGPHPSATVDAFLIDLKDGQVKRAVRVNAAAASKDELEAEAHDRILGALLGRAGVEVDVPSERKPVGKIKPLTEPDPFVAVQPPAAPVVDAPKRCIVDSPAGEVEDMAGGMDCDEARALAAKLNASGLGATVKPYRGR